ncbi:MAG: cob(I)yrinic acid a,c-diamide adenosyltransferase [Roseburia sp.]|nr:cob(I)yrinic acid a,c-diamide adenosyltransferase [Roseburia sp.]MCM1097839.1 cob(I)yrinic acid a,c-diamide adenosyltransferase [Ruminococcus flavefaciens]
MVHLYTGEGKGKTTAAIGLCIRAAGRGFSVGFSQFMKGNDTGELSVLGSLPGLEILRSDKNFGFYSRMSDADKLELTGIHNGILDRLLEKAGSGAYQMIILDELTYPVKWGLLDQDRLKRLLGFGRRGTSGEIELVITGRDASDDLWNRADYITEMKCVRHPYQKGISARRGIEY